MTSPTLAEAAESSEREAQPRLPLVALLGVVLVTAGTVYPPVSAHEEAVSRAFYFGGTALLAWWVARSSGGRRSLGIDRPRWGDWRVVAIAVIYGMFLLTYLPTLIAQALHLPSGNLPTGLSGGHLALELAVGVVGAPIVEETLYRGVALRTLAARMPFWAASVLSSAVFGVAHAPGAWAGAWVVAAMTGTTGLVLCWVARSCGGRIAPGMCAHGVINALAILIASL